MDEDIKTGIPAIIDAARASKGAEIVDITTHLDVTEVDGLDMIGSGVPMLVLPEAGGGMEAQSVLAEVRAWRDEFATKPRRRKGTATLTELGSFVEHVNRFKDDGSAVFLSGSTKAPKFTSVIDYHPKGESDEVGPRFGEHRGVYAPEFSDEWKAWTCVDRKPLTQEQFANLITTNVRDVLDVEEDMPEGRLSEPAAWYARRFGGRRSAAEFYANAQRLLELSEGLTMTSEERVGDIQRRDSGEQKVTFESTISTDIEIPVAMLIEISVFLGGDPWQVPVRLRIFKRAEGDTKRLGWRIELFGADRTVLAVVAEMRERVAAATGLPIFAGSPE